MAGNDNQVFINKHGVIEIKVCGDQTVSSVQAMGDEAIRLATKIRQSHQPALILDNLLEMGEVPVEARKRVAELVKSSDYDKLAMLGSGTLLKLGANLILQATGRGAHVRYFDNRTEAIDWLMR
jgi:UDP-N-acetylmuramyl pentapeptide synthase